MLRLLVACISFGLTAGIISEVFFLWQWLAGPPPALALLLTIALCSFAFLYVLRSLHAGSSPSKESLILSVLFGIVCVYVARIVVIGYLKLPQGEWDAWAIWNLHARFLYRGGGQAWRDMFSDLVYWTHPDYPLLLPSLVAATWTVLGKETVALPALIAFSFTFATLFLLVSTVSFLSDKPNRGVAAGFLFLAAPDFFAHGSYQMADVPFSFYILLTLVLLCLYDRDPLDRRWLILAGAAAGFAASTKNEGLLFLIAIVAARALVGLTEKQFRRTLNDLFWIVCGLAVPLVAVVAFKYRLSPPNDIFRDRTGMWGHLMDPSRYKTIAVYFADTIASFGAGRITPALAIAAYVLYAGLRRGAKPTVGQKTTVATLLLMFAGYFFVYVITPLPLQWHLESSFPRLLLHFWPPLAFCVASAGLRFEATAKHLPTQAVWNSRKAWTVAAVTAGILMLALTLRPKIATVESKPITKESTNIETATPVHVEDLPISVEVAQRNETTSGYAEFAGDGTSGDVSRSLAVLSYTNRSFGSEAVVPAFRPTASGTLLFQDEGNFRTTVSLANSGSQDATIHFAAKNQSGELQLRAHEQLSVFLDERPFSLPKGSGVVTFHSTQPIGVSSLLTFSDASSPFLLANMPVWNANSHRRNVLFDFAAEKASTVLVGNPTMDSVAGHIRWYRASGELFKDTAYSIPALGLRTFAAERSGIGPSPGRIEIVPDVGQPEPAAVAMAFIEHESQKSLVAIPSVESTVRSAVFVEASDSTTTTLLIANPGSRAAAVRVGWKSEWKDLTVPAGHTIEFPLEGFPIFRLAGHAVFLLVSDSPVALSALRQVTTPSGKAITVYPANVESGTVFPNFAVGREFHTQFKIFSNTNTEVSGKLRFFDRLGNPLPLAATVP